MTTITILPDAPNRALDDPGTFANKADAFVAALPTFGAEANAVAGEANMSALNALQYATNALAAQSAAESASNATKWTSGTTYQNGQAVYSGINYLTYRRTTAAGSGTVDPSLDTTNYTQVSGPKSPDFFLINQGVI